MAGWRDLGGMVRATRHGLDLSQRAYARQLGISPHTLNDIEQGQRENYADHTRSVIEAALGWLPGGLDDYLDGREPQRSDDLTRILALWPLLSPVARRALVAVAEVLRSV